MGGGEGGGAADTVRVRGYYLKGNDEKCVHEENASHKCSIEKKKSIDDKNSKIKKIKFIRKKKFFVEKKKKIWVFHHHEHPPSIELSCLPSALHLVSTTIHRLHRRPTLRLRRIRPSCWRLPTSSGDHDHDHLIPWH